ncbi:hypothetical protein F4813DRAFT_365234 [Daldinia decipiens]|uniref:uncharacterized protein n=1 Tax=Daldinia decipiens TaxID=326647 RepID=UPI0020C1C6B6|nr:uncharacterized protein F4813DRAFT_365234 [Daldinia decipiens]KAI1656071.1 hypothetical protein F4813DRAFT_365234 [Daldinia decipiens]
MTATSLSYLWSISLSIKLRTSLGSLSSVSLLHPRPNFFSSPRHSTLLHTHLTYASTFPCLSLSLTRLLGKVTWKTYRLRHVRLFDYLIYMVYFWRILS